MQDDPKPDPTPSPAPTPEPILGKYKNQDELIKAHQAAESKIGELAAKVKELEGKVTPAPKPDAGLSLEPPAAPAEIDIDAILTSAGLSADEIAAQWGKEGKLTDAQYEKFRVGDSRLTRKTIDAYIAGQQAQAKLASQRVSKATEIVYNVVGGEEQWKNLIRSEAVRSMPAARKANINDRIKDPDLAEGAIKELVDAYNKSIGADKSRHIIVGQGAGNAGASGGGSPFASENEAHAALLAARQKHGGNTGDEWKDAEFTNRYRAFIQSKNQGGRK